MRQYWEKLGLVYPANYIHPKLYSHAANPVAMHINDDLFRVFFSGRDIENRSSVGWFDLKLGTCQVVDVCVEPAFLHGLPGTFYSHGVSLGNCYAVGEARYMMFMGWQVSPGEHWKGDIGRLCVGSDLSLRLDPVDAFIKCDTTDPVSLSYPWVVSERDGTYQMWYGSTITWDAGNGEMIHVIKQASSVDGQEWHRSGVCVPWKIGAAQAFSRPAVIGDRKSGYEMWYSFRSGRGERYRIGYATSQDGLQWRLQLENSGIGTGLNGWDSEMIEYPFVFEHEGHLYMLYNGNGYGKSGIGLAVRRRIDR